MPVRAAFASVLIQGSVREVVIVNICIMSAY